MHSSSPQRHRLLSPAPPPPIEFAMAFTSTPRGARLARLFVSHCLDSWGHPYGSDVNETLTLITAELCSNAVRHGRVPGRDFHVRLTSEAGGGRLRLEVSDTRAERRPVVAPPAQPDAESGRGLLLVTALADDWGVTDRRRGPGKTVWAVVRTASVQVAGGFGNGVQGAGGHDHAGDVGDQVQGGDEVHGPVGLVPPPALGKASRPGR